MNPILRREVFKSWKLISVLKNMRRQKCPHLKSLIEIFPSPGSTLGSIKIFPLNLKLQIDPTRKKCSLVRSEKRLKQF